jgi:hypothetical protein
LIAHRARRRGQDDANCNAPVFNIYAGDEPEGDDIAVKIGVLDGPQGI